MEENIINTRVLLSALLPKYDNVWKKLKELTIKKTIMKELSIEEKAKAYDEALKEAVIAHKDEDRHLKATLERIFPELKESEDEKIRKWIIENIQETLDVNGFFENQKIMAKKALSWLEKQGEQKPTDKVEPKFHQGEWIIHQGTENIYQVVAVIDNQYQLKYGDNYTIQKCADVDRCARLWDITKDAKDGDVLYNKDDFAGNSVFIYKGISDKTHACLYYTRLFKDKDFSIYNDVMWENGVGVSGGEFYPATKEQRDLLFQKMKETGYVWDDEKKELRKIENEIEIPFGAKDSELQEVTYYIPKGFHAEIEGNNVIIKKGEQKPAEYKEDVNCRTTGYWVVSPVEERQDNSEIEPLEPWSDDQIINYIITLLRNNNMNNKESKGINESIEIWLKSLKDRVQPQPQQEWSEEDEKVLHAIRNALNYEKPRNYLKSRDFEFTDILDWLKSIKDKYTWKPSEEQMKALKEASDKDWDIDDNSPLYTLYEQLKAL